MANNKIMERVRKLLAMAKDSNSPHEASIAACRARSLMDKHQLQEGDIEDNTTSINFGTATWVNKNKKIPAWKNYLAVSIAKLNDCEVTGEYTSGNLGVMFKGLAEDTEVAHYMFDYLTTAGEYQYSVFKSCQTGLNRGRFKHDFLNGYSTELRDRIKEIIAERKVVTSTGTDLVVLKKQLIEQHFGVTKYGRGRGGSGYKNSHAYDAGVEAGSRQSLHHGVKGSKNDRLH